MIILTYFYLSCERRTFSCSGDLVVLVLLQKDMNTSSSTVNPAGAEKGVQKVIVTIITNMRTLKLWCTAR